MARRGDARPKLSFEQANAICREFVPIGDEVFSYMTRLREAGFEAFRPRHQFIESFAETPEELDIHRRYVVEKAKEWLGQPSRIRIYDDDMKHLFFSPFLQRLREERDKANGVPVDQLSSRYPGGESAWRREVDPCQRRRIQAAIGDRESYQARWSAMLEEERRALELDVARHATGLGKVPHTFDQAGRYSFFSAVMEQDAAPLGFHYDNPKSRPNYPIFSRAISDDWQLCWVIEEARSFFYSPFEGRFEPCLELRSRALRGNLAKVESGEFLLIHYSAIVPGFGTAYWKFFDLNELETMIEVHLYLYGLMAPTIEEGIRKVLAQGKRDQS